MADTSHATAHQPGKRFRIFMGEAQEQSGKPLYGLLLETAYEHKATTAVVLRGIEGFGPEHRLSTSRFPDLADNLPLIVDIVIPEERAHTLRSELDIIVQQGMITSTSVEILRPGGDA